MKEIKAYTHNYRSVSVIRAPKESGQCNVDQAKSCRNRQPRCIYADRLQWVDAVGHLQRMSSHFAMYTPIDIMTRSLILLHVDWWSKRWLCCAFHLPLEPECRGLTWKSERNGGGR